jgi:predicted dehydrogenase
MSPVRAAVVGLGTISFEHLAKLRRRADTVIVGICDLHPTLVRAVSERFGGPPAYTDYERMLEERRPDIVHVLTPPQAHRELALRALEAGAHVFVEKPIAPRWADYVAIRDLAARRGLLLCENYNYRFMPGTLAASAAWREGKIGEAVAVDVSFGGVMSATGAYGDRDLVHFAHQLPGGALQNFTSHPISLALPFIGDCTGVIGARRRLQSKLASDDELRAILEARRASAVITVSGNSSPAHLTMTIKGTEGTIDADVYTGRVRITKEGSVIARGLGDAIGALRSSASVFARAMTGRRDGYEGLGTLLDRLYTAVQGQAPAPVAVSEMDAVNGVMRELFEP